MSHVPSAGWREVYAWLDVDVDELVSESVDEERVATAYVCRE